MFVSGYVLAGGASSRMKQDKALLPFGGAPMLTRALGVLAPVCPVRAILCGSVERSDTLAAFGITVPDQRPGCGPLGGIEAALMHCDHAWAMVVPTDLPLLPSIALEAMIAVAASQPGVRLVLNETEGSVQPLPVLLHRSVLPAVRSSLDDGERKLLPALRRAAADEGQMRLLPLQDAAHLRWFTNVNTPADLQFATDFAAFENESGGRASE